MIMVKFHNIQISCSLTLTDLPEQATHDNTPGAQPRRSSTVDLCLTTSLSTTLRPQSAPPPIGRFFLLLPLHPLPSPHELASRTHQY